MSPSSSALSDGLFRRHAGNPLLTPQRWPYTINAVMNAGAALVDGETVLLCRVEDRRGFSDLTVARSHDGFSNWVVDTTPLLAPTPGVGYESWGLEDARLTRVEELDAWIIAYTSFGPGGPSLSLAKTRDFQTAERLGMVRAPEDKNGALLSRRVNGEWVLFHRPVTAMSARADIWLSRSPDLHSWSAPEPVLSAREGGWWDSARIGIGAPPMETPEGWLLVYHGVRQTVAGALYRAGLALLDLDDPSRVIRRCEEWVLGPSEPYELMGDVPGVVFPCGLVHVPETDELRLYYGAADTCIAMATASLSEVLAFVLEHGVQPE
ncbi:glycosidase [Microlunatus aurantiacus]|uniref:Glycosidase n=1 Tax=Microlunatus aurantiacus TaxID=446786 RepID=A0ABP7DL91_9ACTN